MTRTRTEAEELELQRLIAEQARDDADYQRPQEFGGSPTIPLEVSDVDDDERHDEYLAVDGFEDALLDRLSGESPLDDEDSATSRLVASIVADLTTDLRETYDALYVQRLSTREAGALLGVDQSTMVRRNARLQESIADALAGEVADA